MRWMMALAAGLAAAGPLAAQDMSAFKTGPVIEEFGPHAPVRGAGSLPAELQFAIAFDVSTAAAEGTANRGIESAARFLNMTVAAGVPKGNIKLAVVVHGRAVFDLLTDAARSARLPEAKGDNPTGRLVAILLEHGVDIILCGQTAAAYGVWHDDVIPGIEIAQSAMLAHAVLQQQGYTVNPF